MSLEKHFESYKEKVIPKEAGETQVKETEKAFYAGAYAMFSKVIRTGLIVNEEIAEMELIKVQEDLKKKIISLSQ
jgi:hypothetical protein